MNTRILRSLEAFTLLGRLLMLLSCLALLRLELIDLLRRFHSERRAPRPYTKSILRRTPP